MVLVSRGSANGPETGVIYQNAAFDVSVVIVIHSHYLGIPTSCDSWQVEPGLNYGLHQRYVFLQPINELLLDESGWICDLLLVFMARDHGLCGLHLVHIQTPNFPTKLD